LDEEHPSQMKTRAFKASSSAKKPLKLLPKETVADPFQFARHIQRWHVIFAGDNSFILHDRTKATQKSRFCAIIYRPVGCEKSAVFGGANLSVVGSKGWRN
jgi:hypothetical protein